MASRSKEKPKRTRGRPSHEATDKQRGAVQALAAAGYDQDRIAEYLGIDPKTLRDHYRRELDFAVMELIGAAVGSLSRALKKDEAWATCFVLKTKGKSLGWTERHEVTGKDGAPFGAPPDLSRLTDDELASYIALNKKLAAGDGGDTGREGA